MKHCLSVTLAAACAALCGCSHYAGSKLDTAGTYSATTRGIPFQMTKPVYSLNITPNAEDPTKADYAIVAEDVPDANHRYTIALEPGLLTDGGFEFNYGPGGNFTDGSASLTSRAVATFEAIASAVLSFQTKGVAKDTSSALSMYEQELDKATTDSCKQAKSSIKRQIANLKDYGRSQSPEGEAQAVTTLFYYRSEAERQCLIDVYSIFKAKKKSEVAAQKKQFEDSREKVKDQTTLDELEELVAARDTDGMRKLLNKVSADNAPAKIQTAVAEGLTYLEKLDIPDTIKIAQTFAYMSDRIWRARYVLDLERQLAAEKRRLLTMSPAESATRQKVSARIAALEAQRGEALEAPEIVSRLAQLRKFLAEIRSNAGSHGSQYAASEHIKLAAEYERLGAALDKRRQDLVAANHEPAPTKEKNIARTGIPISLADRDFIKKAPTMKPSELPKYVLVLEPDLAPAMIPTPADSAIQTGNGGAK